jgi:hypothetical protein
MAKRPPKGRRRNERLLEGAGLPEIQYEGLQRRSDLIATITFYDG